MTNNAYWRDGVIFSNNITTGGLRRKKVFMGKRRRYQRITGAEYQHNNLYTYIKLSKNFKFLF